MNALLLTAVLFAQTPDVPKAAPDTKPAAAASLDGNWTVVCYEKNGQPMAEAKDCQVMVKDNVATFTCKNDKDKIVSIRFECGQNGTIKATEIAAGDDAKPVDGPAKTGVIVKTREYVALCIHDAGADPKPGAEPAAKTDPPAEAKAYCTVILKRVEGGERK